MDTTHEEDEDKINSYGGAKILSQSAIEKLISAYARDFVEAQKLYSYNDEQIMLSAFSDKDSNFQSNFRLLLSSPQK